MKDQEVIEAVKKAVFEAGMAFLSHHSFLVETKNGKDSIVWGSSLQNRNTSDFYLKEHAADFLTHAEKAGKQLLKQLERNDLPNQGDVFNEAIGMAMMRYIDFQKENRLDIEMREIKI